MRIANSYSCFLLNEQVVLYGLGKEGFGEAADVDQAPPLIERF